ncbi:MAG: N5-glutamine methyltransferase family protein, partial [Candidatus Puniceispirillaceae bacterium]
GIDTDAGRLAEIGREGVRDGERDGRLRPPALRCLDLGTGSGCLLLALLSEMPNATGIGIDINPDALVTAVENATSLGLADRAEFICHSFADDLGPLGMFDVILSNPPYIPTRDIDDLAVDVKSFDPALALDGGGDGIACWQGLLPRLAAVLKPHGAAFVEIGQGQENMVAAEAAKVNLRLVDSHQDLAGITRCLQFSIKM